jgi:O-succinylbenzoate synthase
VKFGIESAVLNLASKHAGQTLAQFLGGDCVDVPTAALLQGTHAQVIEDAKRLSDLGYKTFKLKVGDRNIALDVKKVQDLRVIIGKDALIRLDGNRVWSLKEALIFAELTGHDRIEFIEEPLSDPSRLNEFYQQTHWPIALDETLLVLRCGITAPGRCSPTLANSEGVKAFVLKPTILGGIIITLDWIAEARSQGKKAIISSSFESPLGLKTLANLACLTGQTAGLGTERWFRNTKPLVNESGIIPAALLI